MIGPEIKPCSRLYAFRFLLSVAVLLVAAQSWNVALAESHNDVLIIANVSLRVDQITKDELRDIFLKRKTRFSSGEKIVPMNVSGNTKLRDEFRDRVLNMSTIDEQRYWQKRKIKQGESQPVAFNNVLKAVFKIRGAISYVYRSQYKKGVAKILLVLPAR